MIFHGVLAGPPDRPFDPVIQDAYEVPVEEEEIRHVTAGFCFVSREARSFRHQVSSRNQNHRKPSIADPGLHYHRCSRAVACDTTDMPPWCPAVAGCGDWRHRRSRSARSYRSTPALRLVRVERDYLRSCPYTLRGNIHGGEQPFLVAEVLPTTSPWSSECVGSRCRPRELRVRGRLT